MLHKSNEHKRKQRIFMQNLNFSHYINYFRI